MAIAMITGACTSPLNGLLNNGFLNYGDLNPNTPASMTSTYTYIVPPFNGYLASANITFPFAANLDAFFSIYNRNTLMKSGVLLEVLNGQQYASNTYAPTTYTFNAGDPLVWVTNNGTNADEIILNSFFNFDTGNINNPPLYTLIGQNNVGWDFNEFPFSFGAGEHHTTGTLYPMNPILPVDMTLVGLSLYASDNGGTNGNNRTFSIYRNATQIFNGTLDGTSVYGVFQGVSVPFNAGDEVSIQAITSNTSMNNAGVLMIFEVTT